jgi:hypothetical protein
MVKRFTIGLLRTVNKDLAWLNSFRPAAKVAGLILGIAILFVGRFLGREWWTKVVIFAPNKIAREAPRYEIASVLLAAIVVSYLVGVIERTRQELRQ